MDQLLFTPLSRGLIEFKVTDNGSADHYNAMITFSYVARTEKTASAIAHESIDQLKSRANKGPTPLIVDASEIEENGKPHVWGIAHTRPQDENQNPVGKFFVNLYLKKGKALRHIRLAIRSEGIPNETPAEAKKRIDAFHSYTERNLPLYRSDLMDLMIDFDRWVTELNGPGGNPIPYADAPANSASSNNAAKGKAHKSGRLAHPITGKNHKKIKTPVSMKHLHAKIDTEIGQGGKFFADSTTGVRLIVVDLLNATPQSFALQFMNQIQGKLGQKHDPNSVGVRNWPSTTDAFVAASEPKQSKGVKYFELSLHYFYTDTTNPKLVHEVIYIDRTTDPKRAHQFLERDENVINDIKKAATLVK